MRGWTVRDALDLYSVPSWGAGFVTINGEAGEELSATEAMCRLELGRKPGFRSLKVEARIGETVWQTSCFPRDEGGWMLPVKALVRKAENISEDDRVAVTLRAV